ncbi:MAG: hypothetical protein KGJ95_04630 [Candidatus Omnitrophica bacterium]|nr:hypothetical protein [Candidatus Omnitrophota bacterium]
MPGPINSSYAQRVLTKVPEITIYFWIVKLLTTAMGESVSDYFVFHFFNPYVAVVTGFLVFIISLILQLSVRRYIAGVYWFAVLMVAVFGTMAADVTHVVLGVPYLVSTAFFAVALVIIFTFWYLVEKTLSIHSIYTPRREAFYWAAVLATFALGTAAGDMTAFTLKLGFFSSMGLFSAFIVTVAVFHYIVKNVLPQGHRRRSPNAVFAFWLAYILTRPLGASCADWMGKARGMGGLGWGDGLVSVIFLVPIFGFVWYLAASRIDVKR